MKTNITILSLLFVALCTTSSALAHFSDFRDPQGPGERFVSAVVELRGLAINRMNLSIVYSDNADAVANAFDMRKRNPNLYTSAKATVEDIGNGKARCTFIFPHSGARGKGYNSGTTVHYAWAKSFVPTGASEELTINSPVRSFVMPRVLVIAYMGDSYASGEGAPNRNAEWAGPVKTKDAEWTDKDCHRSEKSGGMLAIKKLIEEHSELAIRYVNTTCSGAELDDFNGADTRPGFIGNVGWSKPAQLQQIKDWLSRNNRSTVDILLMDGGGNDIGFAPVGTSALTAFFANVSKDQRVRDQVTNGLRGLAPSYEMLNNAIRGEVFGFRVGRIVMMNYPNPLNDENGRLCGPNTNGNNPIDCWGVLERQISTEDMTYLRDEVFLRLNEEVRKAAQRHDWDLADVSQRSARNGLCNCETPYFNTLGQANTIQGDIQGTMHPNARGFRNAYRDPVYTQLVRSINTWHDELKEEARDRAIAAAKEKAKQEAKLKALAAARTKTVKQTFTQQIIVPKDLKPLTLKLDAEDTKAVKPESNDDDNN